jgi:hypothetical protein
MDNTQDYVNEGSASKLKRLLDRVSDIMRLGYYSIRTDEACIAWMIRLIVFHNKRHPKDMGQPEIEAFLSGLASEGNVAALTQNRAFHAILFLWRAGAQEEQANMRFPVISRGREDCRASSW